MTGPRPVTSVTHGGTSGATQGFDEADGGGKDRIRLRRENYRRKGGRTAASSGHRG